MSVRAKLLIIVILAAFLRFYKLGSNPPSLYWDEVSLGYNAYSILKTGRDEHNEFLPLKRFIAFGDYKPVGYVYAAVPSIAIFGLNEFAVRFPSALVGTAMVVFVFLLVEELFPKTEKRRSSIALLASFLFAISPWALHMSRAAFEANLGACFNLLAILFFLKALTKGKYLVFSAIFFVLTLYTFNSNRVLTLILLLGLGIFYFKDLCKVKKWVLFSALLALFLSLPLLSYLKMRESKLRFDEVNIFSNLEVIKISNQRIEVDGNTRLARLIHHRYLGHFFNFLRGYFTFFDSKFLLVSGDINSRLSSQAAGEIYLIELPFLLAGIYYFSRKKNRHAKFLLLWPLAALIPASMARETPHALRVLSILPVPQIFISFGAVSLIQSLKKRFVKKLVIVVFSSILLVSFLYYQHFYYFIYPTVYSGEWQYGYKQLVQEINLRKNDYEKIMITNHMGRPYIYFLFYEKYSPEEFWQTMVRERDWFGFQTVLGFDKYKFGSVNPGGDSTEDQKTLYVMRPSLDIPGGFKEIITIKDLNDNPQFVLVEKQ